MSKNNSTKAKEEELSADGFHGKSYKTFLAATETCACEGGVTTYGMVCMECGKPYTIKTRWSLNDSIVGLSDD